MTTRRHAVHITPQGIDFAIMGNHTERMGAIPGREGIGGKTLMHQRQRTNDALVIQVGIKRTHLVCQQHAFVNQSTRR